MAQVPNMLVAVTTTDNQGNISPVQVAASTPLPVTITSQSVADATTSGTLSTNASVTQALQGQSAVTFQLIPTAFIGTINFEASDDNVNYYPIAVWPLGVTPTGALVTSIVNPASAVLYEGQVAAMSSVRARASGVTAGSVAVTIRASQSTASVVLDGPLPAGTNAIGTVGVTSLPAIPAGANAIGTVAVNAALPAGANTIGNVGLVAGAAAIGTVGVTSLPLTPAGTVATADSVAGTGISMVSLATFNGASFNRQREAGFDGISSVGLPVGTSFAYNGTTFDRTRGNVDTAALVTLTAAAVGGNSADQINYNGRGIQLGINVTAITGTTPSLTVTIQGKDAASGVYYTLLASAAITATGFTLLTVYPGAAATANVSAPQVLPRTFRVLYAIAGTTPAVTATIGSSVIV